MTDHSVHVDKSSCPDCDLAAPLRAVSDKLHGLEECEACSLDNATYRLFQLHHVLAFLESAPVESFLPTEAALLDQLCKALADGETQLKDLLNISW